MRNRLLRALAPEDFALLAPLLNEYRADKGVVLFEADAVVDSVWFLESGVCSLVTIAADGQNVETGLFGRDGFAPVAALLDAGRSPQRGILQIADECFRMEAEALRDAADRSATLRRVLLRYVHVLSAQIAYTAFSNAVHPIETRLARWLLMCHDRGDGGEIALTHDVLAVMLAVRRPSVTTSLHVLEGAGLIRLERGCVIIRNRDALEAFAGDSYGVPEREYERLIGPL